MAIIKYNRWRVLENGKVDAIKINGKRYVTEEALGSLKGE
jgi:hypothetical protein